MILSRNMLKRVGESRHTCRTCSEPISYAAIEEDDTCGLVIEVFDGLDKVCADVVLLHGFQQRCMPNCVECLLEVDDDMLTVLLEIFLIKQRILQLKICSMVVLPALKPACTSAIIFSACGFSLFIMIFSMTLLGWLMKLIIW